MASCPDPETIRDNLILVLPKLVEGKIFSADLSNADATSCSDATLCPDYYFQSRVKEVVSILRVESSEWMESDDSQNITLQFEVTIEAECWFFCWNLDLGDRLPPQTEWEWFREQNNFFLTTFEAKLVLSNADQFLLDDISLVSIEKLWDPEFVFFGDRFFEKLKRPPLFKPG